MIHIRNALKVDIFPAHEMFHHTQLSRATVLRLGDEGVPCAVTDRRKILLAKLRWYADGGEISDRQWSDITGILIQNPNLDWGYVDGYWLMLKPLAPGKHTIHIQTVNGGVSDGGDLTLVIER